MFLKAFVYKGFIENRGLFLFLILFKVLWYFYMKYLVGLDTGYASSSMFAILASAYS